MEERLGCLFKKWDSGRKNFVIVSNKLKGNEDLRGNCMS